VWQYEVWNAMASEVEPIQAAMTTRKVLTEDHIRAWLVGRLATEFEADPEAIDIQETFANYGLGSRTAVNISGELEHWLGRRLPVTLVWDFPTIELLARALAEGNEQAALTSDTDPGPAEA
jgi:acyl carrier protein